ncbi:MAG: hypothetical protein RIS64_2516 [Bacteroidota bacterium]
MKLLQNKIAFVTGGSRGIGAAIVEQFATQGATVGFSYHQNSDAAANILAKLPIHHLPHQAYACDVTQPTQVQNTLKSFLATHGHIDILVNNAGIIKDNLLTDISLEDWNQILATNLTSAYLHICKLSNHFLIPGIWRIMFFIWSLLLNMRIILRISSNCFSNLFTSWMLVPLPFAIRDRLLPLISAGFSRSCVVIE